MRKQRETKITQLRFNIQKNQPMIKIETPANCIRTASQADAGKNLSQSQGCEIAD